MNWIKKTFLIIFIIISIFVCSIVVFVFSNYNHLFESKADCAVVFGAAVWRDNIPSHALQDRIDSAIELYKNKHVNCLILSGGDSTFGEHEAIVMQEQAIGQGVKQKDIYLDLKGFNTLETLKNLPTKKVQSFVMISNDFHLARIRLVAWKLNLANVSFHTAKYKKGRYNKQFYQHLREIVAIGAYLFYIP